VHEYALDSVHVHQKKAPRRRRRKRYDKIVSVTRHTNTAAGNFYRPFKGRSAGNGRYLRQVLQTVRCMQNLQSHIQSGFQLCG
jgi:hypothetical protein